MSDENKLSDSKTDKEMPSTSSRSDTAYKVQMRASNGAFLGKGGEIVDSEWGDVSINWTPSVIGPRNDVEGELTYSLSYWSAMRIASGIMETYPWRVAVRLVPYHRTINTKLERRGEPLEINWLDGLQLRERKP